ncbi:hypothetical protein G8770_23245 [Aestuariicella hydrocarbonica]|uniref:Uncharacterized protein n=1 Tax=Pseudomaricurvus hydrocarbonicus TaxID=1470433 RepID=A0A9E5T515_9GAMM|nr:hypothetical protein [Aestuariicella hydrocarbonica]NHO68479.1 hypothetical protein [Aestuariicella hydrocarbonica]
MAAVNVRAISLEERMFLGRFERVLILGGLALLFVFYLLKSLIPGLGVGVIDLLAVTMLAGVFINKYGIPVVLRKSLCSYLIFIILLLVSSYQNSVQFNPEGQFLQLLVYLKFPLLIISCWYLSQSLWLKGIFGKFIKGVLFANVLFVVLQIINHSILSSIFPGMMLETYIGGARRLTGIFFHPTPLSFVSTLSLIYLVGDKKLAYKERYLLVIFCLFLMYFSGQRGEAVFLLASFLLGGGVWLCRRVIFKNVSLVSSAVVVLGYFLLGMFELNVLTDNDFARLVLFTGAKDVADTFFPIGSGLATYGSANSVLSGLYVDLGVADLWWYKQEQNYLTDTYWAMLIAEAGWLGLLFFLVSLFCFVRPFVFSRGSYYSCVALVFILLEAFTNPIFTGPCYLSLFAVLVMNFSTDRRLLQ